MYYHFAAELLKFKRSLCSLKVIGTDGEEALSNAFGTVFPAAIRLLCSIHKRDNIRSKLSEHRVSESDAKEIMNSILDTR